MQWRAAMSFAAGSTLAGLALITPGGSIVSNLVAKKKKNQRPANLDDDNEELEAECRCEWCEAQRNPPAVEAAPDDPPREHPPREAEGNAVVTEVGLSLFLGQRLIKSNSEEEGESVDGAQRLREASSEISRLQYEGQRLRADAVDAMEDSLQVDDIEAGEALRPCSSGVKEREGKRDLRDVAAYDLEEAHAEMTRLRVENWKLREITKQYRTLRYLTTCTTSLVVKRLLLTVELARLVEDEYMVCCWCEEATAGLSALLGASHLDTLKAKLYLASQLRCGCEEEGHVGDDARVKVRDLYEEVLAFYTEKLGEDHLDTVKVKGALGDLLCDGWPSPEDTRYAHALYEECVGGYTAQLGEAHTETARAKAKLVRAMKMQLGYEEEVVNLSVEIHRVYSEQLGPGHRDTLDIATELASLRMARGEMREARVLYGELITARTEKITICTAQRGLGHHDTEYAKINLANLLFTICTIVHDDEVHRFCPAQRRHREGEARDLYEEVLVERTKRFGWDHPYTLSVKEHLADQLDMIGKHEEAQALMEYVWVASGAGGGQVVRRRRDRRDVVAGVCNMVGSFGKMLGRRAEPL